MHPAQMLILLIFRVTRHQVDLVTSVCQRHADRPAHTASRAKYEVSFSLHGHDIGQVIIETSLNHRILQDGMPQLSKTDALAAAAFCRFIWI